jgi:hypothetical protein
LNNKTKSQDYNTEKQFNDTAKLQKTRSGGNRRGDGAHPKEEREKTKPE